MTEEKIYVIIETFADYVENYYDEDDESDHVTKIVDEHFDEFIDWAYDDFIINEGEQETLKSNSNQDVRNRIKRKVIKEFLMILNEYSLGFENLSQVQTEA